MYYNIPHVARAAADHSLAADIAKAVDGEYSAIICYEQLAKLAPNEATRNQILEIRKDEMRHYQSFSQIYAALTGKQPTPKASEPCESEYGAALDASFRDEQKTVDFYRDIAERAGDPVIKETFRSAADDEQHHAVWFLYFLTAAPEEPENDNVKKVR